MEKPPLLFLCHRIPYPPNKGDKIRSFHLLHHLSRHFDIYLATFVDDDDDWPWVPEVEKYCVDSLFLRLSPKVARLRSLSGLLTGKVLSLPYYYQSKMEGWIRSQVNTHNISHLMIFSAAMAQYVLDPPVKFERKVVDFVDIDSDKWRQYSLQKRWPMSWVYRREGKLLLEFERKVAASFDAGLFVSSIEAAMFCEMAPESKSKIGFYNNGVNAEYFAPDNALPRPSDLGGKSLVFTGAMDYWPNIDAVCWFAHEIFPLLLKIEPTLEFCIVGSSPSAAVTQLSSLERVTVTGKVPDVRPYLQHALAVVAPMRIARGVQNKVLEAMAMEKPVIVSRKGLEGIDAVHGEHVLIADSADEYQSCLLQVADNRNTDLGANARAMIVNCFNWDENLPEVVYLLSDQTRGAPGERAIA